MLDRFGSMPFVPNASPEEADLPEVGVESYAEMPEIVVFNLSTPKKYPQLYSRGPGGILRLSLPLPGVCGESHPTTYFHGLPAPHQRHANVRSPPNREPVGKSRPSDDLRPPVERCAAARKGTFRSIHQSDHSLGLHDDSLNSK